MISFDTISNFFLGSASGKLSANFTKTAQEFDKVLYRDGSNVMSGVLDMNNNRVINVPDPIDDNDVVTLAQVKAIPKGDKGEPGANVMAVASFQQLQAGTIVIPTGTNRVRTSGFRVPTPPLKSVGGADYIYDSTVNSAYVTANPLTSFLSLTETGTVRGFRIDEPVLTPQMLGAKDDGSATTHEVFLALSNTNSPMEVPPGTYLVNNSDPRQINFYSGEIRFAPGARLLFTDSTKIGFFFYKGSPKVRGVTLATLNDPALVGRQNNSAMLRFDDTTDAVVSDVVIERGAGAGVLVLRGTGFRGNNIVIRNTLADGFDFFNHVNGQLSGLFTFNTGDDGLGCVSYADGPQGYGLLLSDINVFQSNTRGISVIGYQNVVLNGFIVEETQGDGLIIERDDTAVTHVPTAVTASNGSIKRAGQRVVDASYVGDKFGIKVGASGSVRLLNIEVVDAKSRGVSGSSSEDAADLYLDGIRVQNAGDEGFFFSYHRRVSYGFLSVKDSRAIGFRTDSVDSLVGRHVSVTRASKGGGGRAVWLVNNLYQDPGHFHVEDLQATMTGNVIRMEGLGRGSTGTSTFDTSGPFYRELNAIYMDIPKSEEVKKDNITPGSGNAILSQLDALDRVINAPLTADVNVFPPQWGMYHGQEVTVTRFDGSGTFSVIFKDANNGNNVITSIPPGSPMRVAVRWDDNLKAWRAYGKITL